MTAEAAKSSVGACIFDVDGTLADTEEVHRRAFNRAFRDCGLDWNWNPAQYSALLAITGGKERIAGYIDQLGLQPVTREVLRRRVPEIHSVKTRHYRRLMASGGVSPRPGIHALLLEARGAGLRLAIASTTSPENIEPLLDSAFGRQARGWFEVMISGDAVARKKPAPDVYHAALAALGLVPAQAIAFEDSAIGVQSAKAAGIFTVATPNRWTETQDFAQADVICGSPCTAPGSRVRQRGDGGALDLRMLAARHALSSRDNAERRHGQD